MGAGSMNVVMRLSVVVTMVMRVNMIVVVMELVLTAMWQRATVRPDSWGRYEIHATLLNAYVFAGYLLAWIPYLAVRSLSRVGGPSRGWARCLLCFSVLGLALARSAWAWLCLGMVGLLTIRLLRNLGFFEVAEPGNPEPKVSARAEGETR